MHTQITHNKYAYFTIIALNISGAFKHSLTLNIDYYECYYEAHSVSE